MAQIYNLWPTPSMKKICENLHYPNYLSELHNVIYLYVSGSGGDFKQSVTKMRWLFLSLTDSRIRTQSCDCPWNILSCQHIQVCLFCLNSCREWTLQDKVTTILLFNKRPDLVLVTFVCWLLVLHTSKMFNA